MSSVSSISSTIVEPARALPVAASFDVVIVGGGIAGVAAAIGAARSGVSVCLMERFCALGGLATLGNVIVYLPLCDGRGRQVLGGVTEELLRLSVRDSGPIPGASMDGIPACWTNPAATMQERSRHRYQTGFNPDVALLAYERLLVDAGVSIWYDTRFCAVARYGDRITHVIAENKDGRVAVECRAVVDASGDADVCHAAGERTESLDQNVLSGWYYTLRNGGDFRVHKLSHAFAEVSGGPAQGPFFRGDVAADVTAQLLGSRELLRSHLASLRAASPGDDLQPIHVATYPCFRMTRRLVGRRSLSRADAHRWFDDAVCQANDWRRPGPVWAVPYDTLTGVANANLTACGRCMSSDRTAWDATRAIPVCGVTGEAAGVASALAVRENGGDVRGLSPRRLADELRSRGNLLSPELVAEAKQPD